MKLQLILWFLAIISTGVMAGLFFTWSNAVTPGIGRLNDPIYLGALKSMNQVILNPVFFIFFFGSVLTTFMLPIMTYKQLPKNVLLLLVIAGGLYLLGVFLLTVFGNIPLNDLLEGSDLEQLTIAQLSELREKIERPWNTYNWIRTLSSLGAFILLLVAGYFNFTNQ